MNNIEKYQNDLDKLISEGEKLFIGLNSECHPEDFKNLMRKKYKNDDDYKKEMNEILSFSDYYQEWYSEAAVIVKHLLPERYEDFINYYRKPKTKRKEINAENYVIEDCLAGLRITSGFEEKVVAAPYNAIPRFRQQLNILRAVNKRFESSLFNISQLLQADLFDSELEAAKELNNKGFTRASGAISGVVLEKHLSEILENHGLKLTKKNPTIADYNDKLKRENIYEIPTWRKIQHLGDLRNLCDHNKEKEPTKEEVEELIQGVDAIIKTVF
jgi:hypothetical protein